MYEYNAQVLKVTDGDTVDLMIDLGLEVHHRVRRCRLHGIDAPETRTPEGKVARDYLQKRLPVGTLIVVKTIKDRTEKYGGYLVILFFDGQNINDEMVRLGYAKKYDGGAR